MGRDWRAFQSLARGYFEKELGVDLVPEILVRLDDGQAHHFDFGSSDENVLIECKSLTFTGTGNDPSSKLNHAKTDAQLLKASHAKRKILAFDDDVHPKKGSFAELFARRNEVWLADVEVWRHWQGRFERVRPKAKSQTA